MKQSLKAELISVPKGGGITGAVVSVVYYEHKFMGLRRIPVKIVKATCSGFSFFTGATWEESYSSDVVKRLDINDECEINNQIQKQLDALRKIAITER